MVFLWGGTAWAHPKGGPAGWDFYGEGRPGRESLWPSPRSPPSPRSYPVFAPGPGKNIGIRNIYIYIYIYFCVVDRENADIGDINKNQQYISYKQSNINLLELDEMIEETPVRTFAKFIKETNDPVYLGKEIKNILDIIFKSNEKDPQAIFNLRYINENK